MVVAGGAAWAAMVWVEPTAIANTATVSDLFIVILLPSQLTGCRLIAASPHRAAVSGLRESPRRSRTGPGGRSRDAPRGRRMAEASDPCRGSAGVRRPSPLEARVRLVGGIRPPRSSALHVRLSLAAGAENHMDVRCESGDFADFFPTLHGSTRRIPRARRDRPRHGGRLDTALAIVWYSPAQADRADGQAMETSHFDDFSNACSGTRGAAR